MQEKIKILVAEDDLQLGFIIKDNLEEAGFQVAGGVDAPGVAIVWVEGRALDTWVF